MDTYGLILLIAMPIFIILILVELIIYKLNKLDYNHMDSISSLFSGMTNTIKDVLGLIIVIFSYGYLVDHLALVHWKQVNAFTYIIAFIVMDFGGYWQHRISHTVNYFWNIHIVHHSSEEYNLPCALRQQFATITNFLSLLCIGIFLAIIGIPKEVYIITAPIHLFMQFWYHTKLIKKMGFLEHIIVTPSHHRVHHSMNDIYMDKNYAQIFIIWDKLFGTFQEELETEPCVYGVRRPARTWNPFIINFQHLWLIIKDSFRTKSIKDKFLIWVKPTGWRPADVAEKYPVFYLKGDDVYNFEKYTPTYTNTFQLWSLIRLISIFLLMGFMFFNMKNIRDDYQYFYYGLFLLFNIFSFTTLMDKNIIGVFTEIIALIMATYISLQTNDWFGLNQFIPNGNIIIIIFYCISSSMAIYFYLRTFKNNVVAYK